MKKKVVKPCLDFLKPPFPLKAAASGLPLFRAPPKSIKIQMGFFICIRIVYIDDDMKT